MQDTDNIISPLDVESRRIYDVWPVGVKELKVRNAVIRGGNSGYRDLVYLFASISGEERKLLFETPPLPRPEFRSDTNNRNSGIFTPPMVTIVDPPGDLARSKDRIIKDIEKRLSDTELIKFRYFLAEPDKVSITGIQLIIKKIELERLKVSQSENISLEALAVGLEETQMSPALWKNTITGLRTCNTVDEATKLYSQLKNDPLFSLDESDYKRLWSWCRQFSPVENIPAGFEDVRIAPHVPPQVRIHMLNVAKILEEVSGSQIPLFRSANIISDKDATIRLQMIGLAHKPVFDRFIDGTLNYDNNRALEQVVKIASRLRGLRREGALLVIGGDRFLTPGWADEILADSQGNLFIDPKDMVIGGDELSQDQLTGLGFSSLLEMEKYQTMELSGFLYSLLTRKAALPYETEAILKKRAGDSWNTISPVIRDLILRGLGSKEGQFDSFQQMFLELKEAQFILKKIDDDDSNWSDDKYFQAITRWSQQRDHDLNENTQTPEVIHRRYRVVVEELLFRSSSYLSSWRIGHELERLENKELQHKLEIMSRYFDAGMYADVEARFKLLSSEERLQADRKHWRKYWGAKLMRHVKFDKHIDELVKTNLSRQFQHYIINEPDSRTLSYCISEIEKILTNDLKDIPVLNSYLQIVRVMQMEYAFIKKIIFELNIEGFGLLANGSSQQLRDVAERIHIFFDTKTFLPQDENDLIALDHVLNRIIFQDWVSVISSHGKGEHADMMANYYTNRSIGRKNVEEMMPRLRETSEVTHVVAMITHGLTMDPQSGPLLEMVLNISERFANKEDQLQVLLAARFAIGGIYQEGLTRLQVLTDIDKQIESLRT